MLPVWLFMVLIAIICYLLFRSISEETFLILGKNQLKKFQLWVKQNQGDKKEI
jgi:hypothetical protein